MTKTIAVADDIYELLNWISADLSQRHKRHISTSECIRYLITFNPTLHPEALKILKRRF